MPADDMIIEAKASLRERMQGMRMAISAQTRAQAAEAAAREGLGFLLPSAGAIIAGYYAVRDEFDCLPLLHMLSEKGFTLALPRIMPKRQLLFLAWQPGDEMATGPLDIPYPANGQPVDPDVLIVPLLAFDARGIRLGYGGGYYDRAITRLRAMKPITAIGIGFDEQRLEAVPAAEYDARLDWVLTPSGLINCRGAG